MDVPNVILKSNGVNNIWFYCSYILLNYLAIQSYLMKRISRCKLRFIPLDGSMVRHSTSGLG